MGNDHTKLKNYLKELGKNLKPLPEHDINEIIREIESLAFEAAGEKNSDESLDEVLAELGTPKQLAETYQGYLHDGKPLPLALRMMRGTSKGASRTLKGLTAFFGYGASLGLVLLAILKPFYPDIVGVWPGEDTIVIGYPGPNSGLREVFGYWLIPFGLVGGGALWILTRKIMGFLK